MKKGVVLLLLSLFTFGIHGQNSYKDSIEKYRDGHYGAFINLADGPLSLADKPYLDFFSPDENYKCDCQVTFTPEAAPITFKTYSNIEKPYKKFAIFQCTVKGESLEISAFTSLLHVNHPVYKNRLFIPFMDYSNGESTYGGGRYLDVQKSDIMDGKITVDFNKAYNPWCAYSEGYNCPIPPRENHFEISIEAGEKKYKGQIKTK